jgi:hypothetical protein
MIVYMNNEFFTQVFFLKINFFFNCIILRYNYIKLSFKLKLKYRKAYLKCIIIFILV